MTMSLPGNCKMQLLNFVNATALGAKYRITLHSTEQSKLFAYEGLSSAANAHVTLK